MASKKSFDDFLENASNKHGDKYDYSKANYVNARTKLEIICAEHGPFLIKPAYHIGAKQGCSICSGYVITTSIFIDRSTLVHGQIFDYSKANYINSYSKIEIICRIHGSFRQLPSNHIRFKQGCPLCYEDTVLNSNNFILKAHEIHNNKYDYSKVIYKNTPFKIEIICKKHGSFWQTSQSHINARAGCPTCVNVISKSETDWLNYLNVPHEFRQKSLRINNKLFKIDACDLENKICWEFYGDYYHGNPDVFNPNDVNPTSNKTYGYLYSKTIERENILRSAGYAVISIWENDWNELLFT